MSAVLHPPIRPSIDAWGVSDGYIDMADNWHGTPAATRDAIYAAMSAGEPRLEQVRSPSPLVIRQGDRIRFSATTRLRLEDGALLTVGRELPRDVPCGYHELENVESGTRRRLIVSPGECYLPDDLKVWGWSTQLYSIRSAQSWGMGDLADLRRLARWSAGLGARLLMINPLAADTPVSPLQASPYSPSSRCYKNLLYLSMEDLPGTGGNVPGFQEALRAGRALNSGVRIDREAVFRLKMAALQTLWNRFPGDDALEGYLLEQGESLARFSRFCALAERFGRDWRTWPAEYRHPELPAVRRFAEENDREVQFHAWVQWLIDEQLRRANAEVPLMQDLPIGIDPGGADAWAWQDCLAPGMYVGAPPDLFNQAGQNWGLPPFVPHRLRAANYEPFIQTIRAALRHAGGLRIDHVMGLFRLYWIPEGAHASAGAYVYYPVEDLLGIIALESQRAKAPIVGEDLGTIEASMRRQLAQRRVLSYRVLWFEDDPPETFPRQALAAVSTHDLPTLPGLWTGQDCRDQAGLGLTFDAEAWNRIRTHVQELTGLEDDAPLDDVVLETYRALARAPSAMITVALEDVLAVEHRPNMPGTIDQWPNWCQPLPSDLETLEQSHLARAIAEELNGRAR